MQSEFLSDIIRSPGAVSVQNLKTRGLCGTADLDSCCLTTEMLRMVRYMCLSCIFFVMIADCDGSRWCRRVYHKHCTKILLVLQVHAGLSMLRTSRLVERQSYHIFCPAFCEMETPDEAANSLAGVSTLSTRSCN